MSSQPAPHPSIETAYLDAEAVLFDERTGSVHQLNPSASAVWMLLDGELSPDQLARELSELFGAPGDVVRADVDTALVDLPGAGCWSGPIRRQRRHPPMTTTTTAGVRFSQMCWPGPLILEEVRQAAPCGRDRSTCASATFSSVSSTTRRRPPRRSAGVAARG